MTLNGLFGLQCIGDRCITGEQRSNRNVRLPATDQCWLTDMPLPLDYLWSYQRVSVSAWVTSYLLMSLSTSCCFLLLLPRVYHTRPQRAEVSGPLKSCLYRQTFLPYEYTCTLTYMQEQTQPSDIIREQCCQSCTVDCRIGEVNRSEPKVPTHYLLSRHKTFRADNVVFNWVL